MALKRAHFSTLLESGPGSVDELEAISENFFTAGGRPWAVLERVRRDRPVSLHGTSMGLGDPGGVREGYLARLGALVDRLEPSRVSDHLCFVGADGRYSHELLPLPFTEEAVGAVSEQIRRVQDRLRRRILIENPSTYFRYPWDAMSEVEFLNAVAREADCGILLDLNNVLVNAHNHGLDPCRFVDAVDAPRVGEYHLAGASRSGALMIDSHVGPVPDPVWGLYRRALGSIGPRPTVVEWDAATPSLDRVALEVERARRIEAEVAEVAA